MCVGIVGWHEIKSVLILRGRGYSYCYIMLYGANPGQGLNPTSLFGKLFFKHQITKKSTYYSIEKIIEDSEDLSAEIGIFKKYDNYDLLEY